MKLNKYDIILGLLIIFEIVLSAYIGFSSQKDSFLCTIGSSCDTVQNSIYGTLFGIKLAWFGVACFSILFILFLIARVNRKMYWMFFLASAIGALLAIYFIMLQVFVLKQICKECVLIDGVAILMLIIVIFEYLNFRKEIRNMEKDILKKVK